MDKVTINDLFIRYIHKRKNGRKCKVKYWRVLKAILYKLKTGMQWRHLPIKQLFGRHRYSWQSVYYHFNKWCKCGEFKQILYSILNKNKKLIDVSITNLDGSHTSAKRGGQAVGYQGRKKSKTTNMLFLTDKNGIPLACSQPVSGNHNDLFEIKKTVSKMIEDIESIAINTSGIFLNADAGFDSKELKEFFDSKEIIHNIDHNKRRSTKDKEQTYVFDNLLYTNRFVVEQVNAWIDGFKTLLVRFETNAEIWHQWHYLAASVLFLRKINKLTFYF